MSYLSDIEAGSLRMANHIRHYLQKEDQPLIAYRAATAAEGGGKVEMLQIAIENFEHVSIDEKLDAVNDNASSFPEALQIAESALTATQAKKIITVGLGSQDYVATLQQSPGGLRRYWLFVIEPSEKT